MMRREEFDRLLLSGRAREMREAIDAITKQLIDDGRIVESGWIMMRIHFSDEMSAVQLDQLRNAFFSGAHHMFGSFLSMLSPGDEPTDADTDRMNSILGELNRFAEDLKLRHSKSEGSG